ncbi:MAG TPA: ATP-dependent endonuclease [Pirellulales bacterium]
MNHRRHSFRFLSWLASQFSRDRLVPASISDPNHRKLLVVLEGRHDISFLRHLSTIVHADRHELPDLGALERQGQLIFVPAGGGDFRPWTNRFSALHCTEFHLYDREEPPESQRREECAAAVNGRPRCRAFVTSERSLENYLHPHAIREARGLVLAYGDTSDVPELAAKASFIAQDGTSWQMLSRRARRRLRDKAKIWLNTAAVQQMTPVRLSERDPSGEVATWLKAIGELLDRGH